MTQAQSQTATPGDTRWRIMLLCIPVILVAGATLYFPPLPQDPQYHNFADQRTMVSVPHMLNVASNLPFVIFGLMGLWYVLRLGDQDRSMAFVDEWNRRSYLIVFAFVALTGIGSTYYHANPTTQTLYWDRLPLTVVFCAFLAIVVAERVGPRIGARLLFPMIAAGVAGITYWKWSESVGAGDIRFYAMIQFGGIVVICFLLVLFPTRFSRPMDLYIVLGWYVLAKLLETLDVSIFSATGEVVSGHTLKHLAAAMAGYWMLRMLKARQPLPLAQKTDDEDSLAESAEAAVSAVSTDQTPGYDNSEPAADIH